MLLLPHRIAGPPQKATLIERSNRFLALCRTDDGHELLAHVPDRGRLETILVPGAEVFLYRAPPSSTRKTQYSLLVAKEPSSGVLVAIDPAAASTRMKPILEAGLFPPIGPDFDVRPEVRLGKSRIDFRLRRTNAQSAADNQDFFVEVKSVGVVKNSLGLFPDAPSERATRHLLELADWASSGQGKAMVIFVVQRGDAGAVSADNDIDPLFARTLKEVSDVVELASAHFEVKPEGNIYRGELEVVLT